MDDGTTRMSPPGAAPHSSSGWLGSSGSSDHGRFPIGTLLGERYRIIGLIGRGGMGEVYRADDLRLGQIVALKFLPPALTSDGRRLAQLHQEVRAARQVAHPNVCRVYDIVEADGHLFVTMEYVDGEDLAASLRRIGRFPEDKAIDIARQICAGLTAVHSRGIVLRDLKPANLMLDATGSVRLVDFGLAAFGVAENVREGTPAYMAPEQIDGREATRRSDIYALGLVLYEVFTGRRVFEVASVADLALQHASGDVTPLTSIVKHLDPAIERAILRCLEREPERRPSSPLAVAASLPGGDPLAAAVAAGETPSPELVAAAGTEHAALSVPAGLAWIGLMLAALVTLGFEIPYSEILSMLPVEKSRAVLEDHALGVISALGARGPVYDTSSGFSYDGEYLTWLDRRDGTDRRDQLRRGRPAPMRFWLRTSPVTLVPFSMIGDVRLEDDPDPPLARGGMTAVELDLAGRLITYITVPPSRDAPDATPRVTNWTPAFQLADLDPNAFHDAPSTWTPLVNSDERRAWQGTIPELPDTPLTIEGAASHGTIVQFSIRGPWTRSPGDVSPVTASRRFALFGGLVFLALVVGGLLWAWRNYVNGRGDRRGARRLALFVVALEIAHWMVGGGQIHGFQEIPHAVLSLGPTLLFGLVAYAFYLAAEPFVRKGWPHSLISWSRLVSGRYRDPLVGRDLLIGIAVGLSIASVTLLGIAASLATRRMGLQEAFIDSTLLLGWHGAWGFVIVSILLGLYKGLLLLFVATAAQRVLRRRWLALLVVGGTLTALDIGTGLIASSFWIAAAVSAIRDAALVLTLARFGLFAVCVSASASGLAAEAAFSVHWSLPHVAYSWPPMLFLVGVALIGFWMATSVGVTPRDSGSASRGSPAAA
jgi:serine/threonine-protein kinase